MPDGYRRSLITDWRLRVQADDVADLGCQLGVGGELEALALPRFHPVPLAGRDQRFTSELVTAAMASAVPQRW
jgi:hypothetical protein